MRTTVEIPDHLAEEIRKYAAERGLSLNEVYERALRNLIRANRASGERFRLKMITSKGEGLQVEGGWDAIHR